MKRLIADSGSTKTLWAMVDERAGQPTVIHTAQTQGLNPLYVEAAEITQAFCQALRQIGEGMPYQLNFYGSGCSGERIAKVEQALRAVLTPMTRVIVESDLMGAALALSHPSGSATPCAQPFISSIMGTGSIAALFDPAQHQLTPMPALGYILGDEGSGAWFGRRLLGDYLKRQMPPRVREAFEADYGVITPEQAVRHVYQQSCPNRYLATFAAFVGRHDEFAYTQELAYSGIDAFWRRNILPIDHLEQGSGLRDVRLVGSVAWHLQTTVRQVADMHGYVVTQVLKDPIEGLVDKRI